MIKHSETAIVINALMFASGAHAGIGQLRKYTNEPYIVHPIGVAELLSVYVPDVTEEMIAAALLHDVVEDTKVSIELITSLFGNEVSQLVYELTNKSSINDGNRATRARKDKEFLATVSAEAQTIKIADLIHNTSSITQFDQAFAEIYLKEKSLLLDVLIKASPVILEVARAQLNEHLKCFN